MPPVDVATSRSMLWLRDLDSNQGPPHSYPHGALPTELSRNRAWRPIYRTRRVRRFAGEVFDETLFSQCSPAEYPAFALLRVVEVR